MPLEFISDKTEKFFSAKVHQVIGGEERVTPATCFFIPEDGMVKDVQEFLKESFMERMGTMIEACATEELKESVRNNIRNAYFTDVHFHIHNFKYYKIENNAQDLSLGASDARL